MLELLMCRQRISNKISSHIGFVSIGLRFGVAEMHLGENLIAGLFESGTWFPLFRYSGTWLSLYPKFVLVQMDERYYSRFFLGA